VVSRCRITRGRRIKKIAVAVPRGQNDDGDHGNMTGVDGRTQRKLILLQIRVTFGRVHATWPDVRAEASEVGSYPVYFLIAKIHLPCELFMVSTCVQRKSTPSRPTGVAAVVAGCASGIASLAVPVSAITARQRKACDA
jgi:hypothetical protein